MTEKEPKFLESIDALGYRPDRHDVFSQNLLAEAEDETLQSIVEEAAQELKTPIALVNLVLEEIQFFKAHYGLPSPLAAARGTERDVSFCQFVVRDGEPFEVTDAKTDPRVPQHLVKNYDIQAYLGIPIQVEETIVGSLCVIDTKPRPFSQKEREDLTSLAARVNERLAEIHTGGRFSANKSKAAMTSSAFSEIAKHISSIEKAAIAGPLTISALGSFFRLAERTAAGEITPAEHLERAAVAARKAIDNCEDYFYNIQADVGDIQDLNVALEKAITPTRVTQLTEVIFAAWELSQSATEKTGGLAWPNVETNRIITTPRPVAVTLLATAVSIMCTQMINNNIEDGLAFEIDGNESNAEVRITNAKFPVELVSTVASELTIFTKNDPSISIEPKPNALVISFSTLDAS
jgi:hypothetical protein